MQRMTTAQAAVATLVAHGIDTIYALPGIHNDHLFDALFGAQEKIRTIHTRHEQGAAYMALGAAIATDVAPPDLSRRQELALARLLARVARSGKRKNIHQQSRRVRA